MRKSEGTTKRRLNSKLTMLLEQEETNSFALAIAERRDKRRLDQSERRSSSNYKRNKINKKINKTAKTNQNRIKEGDIYSAGCF